MLRIAFDAKRLFNNFTGLGNYSRTLVQSLAAEYPEHAYYLYTPSIVKNAQTNAFTQPTSFQIRKPRFSPSGYWRSFGLKRHLRNDQIQIYHGLSHEIPLGIQRTNIKSVVTIHDLIFKNYPNNYSAIDRAIYDYKFKYACSHANQIVAISRSTKQDIIKFYNIPAEKIQVVYQNCDPAFNIKINKKQIKTILDRHRFPKEYFLYVGSITKRKNLLSLVKALVLLPEELRLPLVVIGEGSDYKKKVVSYIQQHQLDQLVYFAGHVNQNDLPAVYQGATIFIYPSFYEGFGIPIIESLYSKTPVITSNLSSLPEAAGPNAFYIDPSEPDQIATGIKKILLDKSYRLGMINKGYEYVLRFNKRNSTMGIMRIYERLL